MKGTIRLSHNEIHRAQVLDQVIDGGLSLGQAAKLMGVSYRQAKRLKQGYLRDSLDGLAHGSRERPAANAVSAEIRTQIVTLRQEKYIDFNDTHFTEMLHEDEHIEVSRETVRKILREAGIAPKRSRRPLKHRSRRERRSQAGVMIQWDGSPHRWLGPDQPVCCLMTAIDDATSKLLAAVLVPVESALAYLMLLDMVIKRHGVPLSIYQDRHGALKRNDDFWTIDEQLAGIRYPTHVGRVLQELQITPISAHSPQAKGRVERGFGVLQDRLIAELALHGLTDMGKANAWIEKVFIGRFNKRFAKPARESGSAFRKLPYHLRYKAVTFAYEATVANDNCVRLGDIVIDIPATKLRRTWARAKVLVKQHLDGAWSVWHEDQRIARHPATKVIEPIRSWKRRGKGRTAQQVYLSSKPAFG
jgi:transposase